MLRNTEQTKADISDQEFILHQNHLAIKKNPSPELTDHRNIHADPIFLIPSPTTKARSKKTTVNILDIRT